MAEEIKRGVKKMSLTKKGLIYHASIFEFRYGKYPSDRVYIEKRRNETPFYNWVIKWGGGIWSKRDQLFMEEVHLVDKPGNYEYSLEDAFEFLNHNNPIEIHRKRLKELKLN